jgi:hypothetical protein
MFNFFFNKEKFWIAKKVPDDIINDNIKDYDDVNFNSDKTKYPNVEKYAQDCAYTLSSTASYTKMIIKDDKNGIYKCYAKKFDINKPFTILNPQ